MVNKIESIRIDNFNGGVVTSVDPLLLSSNQLQYGKNIRFSKAGGVTNRSGYSKVNFNTFLSSVGQIDGAYATDSEVLFVNNGKVYVTLEDLSDAFEIISGLTVGAFCRFYEYSGNVYVFNGIDELKRINISRITTTLVAGVSTSVVVKNGNGWRFPSSGTVKVLTSVGLDDITVTSKTNDTLTITAGTVSNNAPIESKIYFVQSISDSTANQRFQAYLEFKNRGLAAIPSGKAGSIFTSNTLLVSRAAATITNIDYFHDFVGSGANAYPIGGKGELTGIFATKNYVAVTKKNSTFVVSDYNSSTGVPIIEPVTEAYGATGPNAGGLVGDQLILFGGKQIKQFGEQVGLNNVTPSFNAKFDDKIHNYLATLEDDQTDAILLFNPEHRLMKLWVRKDGSRVCIVYDDKIDGWSFDFNKPASCAFLYKGKTYWGSEFEPKLFLDEDSNDDDGNDIEHEFATATFDAGSSRLSKYFQYLFIKGKIGETTSIIVQIYYDNVLTQEHTITAKNAIKSSTSDILGLKTIGLGGVGILESGNDLYEFKEEILLKKRKNVTNIFVAIKVIGQGQIFEIEGMEINGFYSKKFDKLIRK